MPEVYLFPSRLNREGAERLAESLEQALGANVDHGPRWPQIRSLGLSLQNLSRDLEHEVDRMGSILDPTPEIEAFRDSIHRLADTFSRLGTMARAYPYKA